MKAMNEDSILITSLITAVFTIALLFGSPNANASAMRLPEDGKKTALQADYILVDKSARRMTLFAGQTPIKSFRISLGKGGIAPKERQGDKRTPEGRYTINGRNPNSNYHLSLRISYPNHADRARAASMGASPGGDIFIHGIGPGLSWWEELTYPFRDWTAGCIAVTDADMEEIWELVPNGAIIDIKR